MRKIIGERLEEERERLGKKKGEMASIGGVVGSAYTNYLEGKRAPDADFLAAIAAAGADVQYILTGIRSQNMPGAVVLRPDQAAHLDHLEHCAKEDQEAIKRWAFSSAKAAMDETQQPGIQTKKIKSK